jgi:hypothetical protein
MELKLRFGIAVHLQGNHTLAGVERPALFGAADVGLEGAVREEREDDLGAVEGGFDSFRPAVARFQALAVQPCVEAEGLQVGRQAARPG